MNTEQALEMIIKRLDGADKARVRIFKRLEKIEKRLDELTKTDRDEPEVEDEDLQPKTEEKPE